LVGLVSRKWLVVGWAGFTVVDSVPIPCMCSVRRHMLSCCALDWMAGADAGSDTAASIDGVSVPAAPPAPPGAAPAQPTGIQTVSSSSSSSSGVDDAAESTGAGAGAGAGAGGDGDVGGRGGSSHPLRNLEHVVRTEQ
jgi:hypothetical protein